MTKRATTPEIIVDKTFKRRLKKKPPELAGAILKCVDKLGRDPRDPTLNTHRVLSTAGVWEAYVDRANRVTFHYAEDGAIVMRNHCNHDIIEQSP